ncbi:MAG: peptide chain release factor N(5)-glutamine methyltransferase [Clostridia bacterium]|nr:peptide chain release factor N(5)-glutamine methyltransferase [Clostridia bacterium]
MKLSEATHTLRAAGIDSASHDARIIFSELGGISIAATVGTDPESSAPSVIDAIERRAKREPLQYIIGRVDFYREKYTVSPDCLIPRQDTELLVDFAVKNLPRGARLADLCTGSGCIAISVLCNTTDTTAVCADISAGAIKIATKNSEENGVADRAAFVRCDVLGEALDGEFFAVISNPPYVTERAYSALAPEIYFEPREAFVGGGEDGTEFYERITELYHGKIAPRGFIAYEIGYDQADALKKIAQKYAMSCEILKDFSGLDRVAILRN